MDTRVKPAGWRGALKPRYFRGLLLPPSVWCQPPWRGRMSRGLGLIINGRTAVHGLAVVPHHEIVHRPFVDVNELRLRGVLGENRASKSRASGTLMPRMAPAMR